MTKQIISQNALHIDMISTMRQLIANIAAYDFDKFSYQGLRVRIKDECKFLGAEYIVLGQHTTGYKCLMTCEDSELLTDIAHGLNRFIETTTFKFDVKKKADLEDVFLAFRAKLDQLCIATLSELNSKSDLVFELPKVSALTTERVLMIKHGQRIHSINMSYFYAELKEAVEARALQSTIENNDYAAAITEKTLTKYKQSKDIFIFPLPCDEKLAVSVGNGGQQAKYFVIMCHLGREGSHLATRRAELKKDAEMLNTPAEIVTAINKFIDTSEINKHHPTYKN